MKILHTSDWHLGNKLHGHDRSAELKNMLEQIAGIVQREEPDLFLLCGDIYDRANPTNEQQGIFSESIVRIQSANRKNPHMPIVVIAGNHDSASEHETFTIPWRMLNVYSIGDVLDNHSEGTSVEERRIIPIPNEEAPMCYVIAIPFSDEDQYNNNPEFVSNLLAKVVEMNTHSLPVIMMAHTTVSGANFMGHESTTEETKDAKKIVGGIESVNMEQFGSGYDYLALGHIHKPQCVDEKKSSRVWYSGSPIAINFNEDDDHYVNIVTIDHHGDIPDVRQIPITNLYPLVTLPSRDTFATWEEALQMLRDFPADKYAYIRLNVEGERPSDAMDQALEEVKNRTHQWLLTINSPRIDIPSIQKEALSLTIDQLQSLPPVQLAKKYIEDNHLEWEECWDEMFEEAEKYVPSNN